jgi:transcriptional regulator with XRE-family HTH domain
MVRFGRGVRALRQRRRWRQIDLAASSGVSRERISRIERGGGETCSVRELDRVAQALGARTYLRLDWNGEALDRLLDADHARLVEAVVRYLRDAGWDLATEVTFSIAGERGSVDVLGRHPASAMILVVEVKSVVPDVQATLASLDRKARLGVAIARQLGWTGSAVGRLIVIGESRTSRRRVEAHHETFALKFPDRIAAIRRWIAQPDPKRPLRGLWFQPVERPARHRVRSADS